MAEPRLDALPKELIASIASYSNARTVLSLGQTCRRIATACNTGLVFKSLLLNSQADDLPESQLDIDAIATRCGKNVDAWARYAVADQTASEVSRNEHPFRSWDHYQAWVPELLAVSHPFVHWPCWHKRLPIEAGDASATAVYCLAQAVIAGDNSPTSQRPERRWSIDLAETDPNLKTDASLSDLLWEFSVMVMKFHKLLKTRRNAWPYNNEAVVPYISLPTMRELSRPDKSDRILALPYAGTHDQWFLEHTRSMIFDPQYFTTGTWRGYYSYSSFFMSSEMLDPPMMGVKFSRVETASGETQFLGEDGFDGEGPFRVHVIVSGGTGDGFDFRGQKAYKSGHNRWDWDLKLTPLGLIGYWGTLEKTSFSRKGFLWLWKVDDEATQRVDEAEAQL